MIKKQHYTFGDNELAARRLALLAQVFEQSSRRLLRGLAFEDGQGIDLGCGPGYTTTLVADSVPLTHVTGLDQSERLLAQANAERASERVSYARCDVSAPPFPVPAADLLYSRFLLTHLREPAQVIRAWASAAAPGALLVLEETAFLRGNHPTFPRYYELVERMQAHYGQRMYIGQDLAALGAGPEWAVEHAEIFEFAAPASDMAQLHCFNLQTWANDPFARETYSAEGLAELRAALEQIVNGEVRPGPVSCGMGQVVLRRR